MSRVPTTGGTGEPGAEGDGDPGNGLSGLAPLAFGSLSRIDEFTRGRHLALLRAETLELDLSDPAQRQFGDYELLEQIGEGGMGVVYRAHQASLDREVAVKLLAAGPWASGDFIARFEREARNAARMQHPNIVTVYEVGDFDGLRFFSMRLVEGQSLSTLFKRGRRFAPKEAAQMMRTVAEAVAYAHSLGVLHLDLKPANVLVDGSNTPYVADFGLAKRLDNAPAIESEEVSGTPSYMAPEQAEGRAIRLTAATDIWGLGAILYELLTSEPPFRGDTAQATLRLVREGRVRAPRRWNRSLPLDLQAIVLKCLEKDPERRYAGARALADDLARFVEGRPVQARPLNLAQRTARWTKREPKLAVVTFLAFTALVVGLLATLVQSHRAGASADLAEHTLWTSRTTIAQREIEQGNAYPALVNAVANLREMEASGDRDDAVLERLRIGTVLANAPQLIDVIPLGDKQITALAISPDARVVAAAIDRSVRAFDVASGRQLWQVDTRGKSFGNMDFHDNPIEELRFSGDGRHLIGYTIDDSPGGDQSTMRPRIVDSVLIGAAAGKVVDPPRAFADFLATSYGDDGRYALLFDRHGGIQRWRTQPWAPAGDKVVFKDNINDAPHDGPLMGAARLADGGAVMILVSNANLIFRSFDAGTMRPLRTLMFGTAQGRATAWALRHDGRQLAIGTVTGQVALWDPESGNVVWLHTQLPGRIATLRFSADDSRLLVVSNAPSELDVFDPRSRALVAEPMKLSTDTSPNMESGIDARFGADARTLLTRHWAGGATLWRLPVQGFPLKPPVAVAPVMAAEGARFALATDARSRLMATADNGQLKLWRLRPPPLTDRIAAPMVTAALHFDGRHLVSVEGNRVSVFDIATGLDEGRAIVLPEAPTFAGLDGSGSRLIAFSGREVSCWNWRNGNACWSPITLPDSPLRLGMAAHAPALAVSTGSNANGEFFEHVRLIDLATGRERGAPITLRGPLGALRFSDDGNRLLTWQDSQSENEGANVLTMIDALHATILHRLAHGRGRRVVIDARFLADGTFWSLSSDPWNTVDGGDSVLRHWSAAGQLLSKRPDPDDWASLLPLPDARGVIAVGPAQLIPATGQSVDVNAPDANARDNAAAISPDGSLLALATIDGVALTDIPRNERLLPELKLPLPHDEVVQQLAFAPDGSRLVGRTTGGRWFQWPLVIDRRPAAAISRDVDLHDFTPRDMPPTPLSSDERRRLRAADPGPEPVDTLKAVILASSVAAPAPSPDYRPLDLDPIANVDPRTPMNHATRLPPQPQDLPGLPRGLQRYDGVDFLLGRAVQLSGKPQNILDAEFPSASRPLAIGAQRVSHIDLLVMQYLARFGAVGAVHLRYADGSERAIAITSPDEVRQHWMDAATNPRSLRVGWLGSFAGQMLIDAPNADGAEVLSRTYVVRLANPEPDRPVESISFSAPPNVSPGLLFLALTLEPVSVAPPHAGNTP